MSKTITVCAECLRACCWQGVVMCQQAREASTVEMPVGELRKLKREHPKYWGTPEETPSGFNLLLYPKEDGYVYSWQLPKTRETVLSGWSRGTKADARDEAFAHLRKWENADQWKGR